MVITWVTFAPTPSSQVLYGFNGEPLSNTAYGSETEFVHKEGKYPVTRFIHRVNVTDLIPLAKYGKRLVMCHILYSCELQVYFIKYNRFYGVFLQSNIVVGSLLRPDLQLA